MVQEAFDLTRNLGGCVVELEGDFVAEAIIHYVTETDATLIVMGQSARSRMQEIFRGSTINRIMRETKGVDIVVVADFDKDD